MLEDAKRIINERRRAIRVGDELTKERPGKPMEITVSEYLPTDETRGITP
jgi:hypothetical protein